MVAEISVPTISGNKRQLDWIHRRFLICCKFRQWPEICEEPQINTAALRHVISLVNTNRNEEHRR